MSLSVQSDFLANVNRMFDNHPINKNGIDESQREKFINRATALRDAGVGDITEQAKITGSFFREFSSVSVSSMRNAPTHEERLTALGQRYAEMRNELMEMFKDNEDEYYSQIEKLNLAFKGALDSTCLTPIYSFKTMDGKLYGFTKEQEAERIRFEEEVAKRSAEYENTSDVMKNFRDNLSRHVNTFYENFINSIQTNDYDTAFQESMSLLKSSKTTSYNEISYTDMVRIMDVLNNIPIEFDENGTPAKMRYTSADQSFRELIKYEGVSYSVRKAIADIFNFYIENEEQQEKMEEIDKTTASNQLAFY
ncbi:MAG TPA: hypothetical protein VFD00_09225 [Thermoclostridium sp.]|nr:hypothetical protein [Thermoclostridium sp.]